jgi:hypothetical protein
MSTPIIACSMLLLAGVLIGSLPFIAGFRDLPRWIRIAQFLIGLTFITGAVVGVALYSSGHHLSPQAHQFIFLQIVLIVGMGLGIILLLLLSGEYFKALRELDAARRRRLSDGRTE